MKIYMHKITDDSLNFGSDSDYKAEMERNALKVAKEIVAYGMGERQIHRLMKGFLVWPQIVRYQKPYGERSKDNCRRFILRQISHHMG